MFLGHFAVAFAARRCARGVSLGTLFLAAQLADLVWPVLVLAGVERFAISPGITAVTPLDFVHYPWSHSLVALCAWGAGFGALYWALRGGGMRAAALVAGVVVSHWILDAISHRPDMPLAIWESPKVGLGLWNSAAATLAIEALMFAAALALYVRGSRPVDRTGRWALWALVAFLSIVYVANLAGPPPPSVAAVAWSANALWLVVAWAYWIDRHREQA
jgi:hypothetical protein